jgi:HEAT repeat protein
MQNKKISGRQLKGICRELLQAEDFEQGVEAILRLPPRRAVNPLFSFLCSSDERLRWRAVTAMGRVVSDLAASDIESARVVMRRLIWQLNDESGGIGWGCPEAMAEAMAQNERLAEEYGCILISYIQPQCNYLEHESLQRGVLWGIGRLAHGRPRCVKDAAALLLPYMKSPDPVLRGLAAWAAAPIAGRESITKLRQLVNDPAEFSIYCNGRMVRHSVGRLAGAALAAAEQRDEHRQK